MRSSHSTLLVACGAAIAAISLTGSPSAHAATAVAETQCAGLDVSPTAGNRRAIRASILCLTKRGAHAAPPAAAAREIAQLRAAAVAHSADMVARSYFAHTTPTGQTFVDRILHAGHTRRGDGWSLGENLAWGTGDLGTARGIQAAWMHSSGHRTNILKPAYREVGIGVHRGVPDDARRRRHLHAGLRGQAVISRNSTAARPMQQDA